MARILGISCYFHDSAAAVVVGNRLVAASAEERFSARKHDAAYPRNAIDFVLAESGLDGCSLDHVVFYERPHVALGRALSLMLVGMPGNWASIGTQLQRWFTRRIWIRTQLAIHLGISPARISFCPHHEAHAAHAFLLSPYERSAVLTLDAVGEWASGGIYLAKRDEGVHLQRSLGIYESVGLTYAAVTRLLGLKPNSDECSTMALSAFSDRGDADLVAKFRQGLDAQHMRLAFDDSRVFAGPLAALSGEDFRPFLAGLDAREPRTANRSPASRRPIALAAAAQSRLEERVTELAKEIFETTGSRTLCLAGGVANNSVLVSKLVTGGALEPVYVPLDPGDAGAAVGAAAWQAAKTGVKAVQCESAYLGKSIKTAMDEGDLSLWRRTIGETARVQVHSNIAAAARHCAQSLCEGRVVAWAQGRAEFGPRALGNRSILALPNDEAIASRIATDIKLRQRFRPFALSILREDAEGLLDLEAGLMSAYRWMQATAVIKPSGLVRLRGAMHVDGTTRPQIVDNDDEDSFLPYILREVRKCTGLGGLLNTSMNIAGMPLVNDETEALLFFRMTRVDSLYCSNLSVHRIS